MRKLYALLRQPPAFVVHSARHPENILGLGWRWLTIVALLGVVSAASCGRREDGPRDEVDSASDMTQYHGEMGSAERGKTKLIACPGTYPIQRLPSELRIRKGDVVYVYEYQPMSREVCKEAKIFMINSVDGTLMEIADENGKLLWRRGKDTGRGVLKLKRMEAHMNY